MCIHVFLVLCVLSYVQCIHIPVQLVADLQAHFHPGCTFILHSSIHDMELITAWTRLARILLIGNIQVEFLLHQPIYNCTSPLYVIIVDQQHILQKVSAAEMFNEARWIVLAQKEDWFDSLNIPFDCEFLVMKDTHLEEVYQISPEYPLVYTKFGDFQPETWPQFGLYTRRNNLQGYVMKAAVLDDSIFTTLIRSETGDKLGGFFGQLWCQLEHTMNFTSEFHESVDGGTGSEVNGSWNGMVGMIVKGDVMIGAYSFLMTTKRMDVVDYTQGFADARNYVYIRKPNIYLLPWSNTLAPFSAKLWFCVIATTLLLTIFLAAITSTISCSGMHVDRRFNFQNTWLYVFGIFCYQGHDVTPHSLAGRSVYIISYVCAVVLFAGYAGNYTSFLTAGRSLALPFHTFQGMLNDGTYTLGAIAKSAQIDIFRTARDGLFMEIYKKIVQPDMNHLPNNYTDAFRRVCYSKYALMSPAILMKKFALISTCEFIHVPHAVIPGLSAMTAKKKCPFLGLINYNIQKMRDRALLKIIEERTLNIKKTQFKQKDWDAISVDEVIPVLSVFLLGVLASILIAMAECFLFWMLHKRCVYHEENKSCN